MRQRTREQQMLSRERVICFRDHGRVVLRISLPEICDNVKMQRFLSILR